MNRKLLVALVILTDSSTVRSRISNGADNASDDGAAESAIVDFQVLRFE